MLVLSLLLIGVAIALDPLPLTGFLVTKANRLGAGEEDRAREWGRRLAGHTAGKVATAG